VGTASIEKSELLSSILKEEKIEHHVLNAKKHEREADIIAQAGRVGAVTISTNMAGRGTDILLGGNPEFLAAAKAGTRDPENEDYKLALAEFREICAKEKEQVKNLGGLHILGTERHESRRIDNQLRGRAGRQGDQGSSQFFVAFDDDLMKRFGGEGMRNFMLRVAGEDDEGIQGRTISSLIEKAQRRVEGHHFEVRKHLLEYDDVLNKQREVVYGLREQILLGKLTEAEVKEVVLDVIEDLVSSKIDIKLSPSDWNIEEIARDFHRMTGIEVDLAKLVSYRESDSKSAPQKIYDDFKLLSLTRYDERVAVLGTERMNHLIRLVYLQAIDYFWKDHLTQVDHLREGINLRGYAQKNPLHEYQREAFVLFSTMMEVVKSSLIQHLFLAELPTEEEIRRLEEEEKERLKLREQSAIEKHIDPTVNNSAESKEVNKPVGTLRSKASTSDYQPTKVAESQNLKEKRSQSRKKTKDIKTARKKNR
jgi:preprotein translocase subunit SecA